MKKILLSLMFLLVCGTSLSAEVVYEGVWKTKNRRLDGRMTCVVTDQGQNKWHGRFYGVWRGVEFDYEEDWTGTPDKLTGKTVIDGANYEWTGTITAESFKGKFTGDRYNGSFDLKLKAR